MKKIFCCWDRRKPDPVAENLETTGNIRCISDELNTIREENDNLKVTLQNSNIDGD